MSSPAKILVVDDTPNNVKLLADVLTVKGFTVATAASGEEALSKIAADMPDLVLLDVMMPGLSGYDVCRRIRADPNTRTLPVVILTSSKEEQDVVNSYLMGVNSYVRKPVDFVQFVEAIRQLGLYWLVLNEAPPR